jgi:hypothetical protein
MNLVLGLVIMLDCLKITWRMDKDKELYMIEVKKMLLCWIDLNKHKDFGIKINI